MPLPTPTPLAPTTTPPTPVAVPPTPTPVVYHGTLPDDPILREDEGVVTRLCVTGRKEDAVVVIDSLDEQAELITVSWGCPLLLDTSREAQDGWAPVIYHSDTRRFTGWVRRTGVFSRRDKLLALTQDPQLDGFEPFDLFADYPVGTTIVDEGVALDYTAADHDLPHDFPPYGEQLQLDLNALRGISGAVIYDYSVRPVREDSPLFSCEWDAWFPVYLIGTDVDPQRVVFWTSCATIGSFEVTPA